MRAGCRSVLVVFIFLLAACDWVDKGVGGNIPPRVYDDGPYIVPEGGKADISADIGPLSNDEDGGNQGITAILVEPPKYAAEGGFKLYPDGSFTYVHDGSEHHEDYFVYIANDGIADSEQKNVLIKITPVNDPPVINGQEQVTVAEDSTITLGPQLLKVSDPDNLFPDDFTLEVLEAGDNYSFDGTSIKPGKDYNGPIQIPVLVNDGTDNSNRFELEVTVTPVNDAPVITGWNQELLVTGEDTALPITLDALEVFDVEGDAVTLQVQPGNGYVVAGNTVTAAPDWFGELAVEVQVSDGQDASKGQITVVVEPVNDAPRVAADRATTLEDTDLFIDVTQNDADPEGNDEIDRGALEIVRQPEHGRVAIDGEGIRYYPDTDFNGEDSFGYTVADIHGAVSGEGVVTVTVEPVNDAPIAENDQAKTAEDTPKNIDVTKNDRDPDGVADIDKGSITIITPPAHGTAVPRNNGTVDYTPKSNYYGKDKFTYQIRDASGVSSNTATVSIVIDAVNDPPYADDDSATTNEDEAVTIRVTDGDRDEDGEINRNSVAIVKQPAHGQAVVRPRGQVIYTPAPDYFGTDSFVYRVEDDEGALSNPATVTITVVSVNDPPRITGQSPLVVQEDGSLPLTLNDLLVTDPDNSYPTGFSLTILDGDNYTVSNSTIEPASNFAGTLQVPVVVNDGQDNSDPFILSITVTAVNDPPVISGTPATRVNEGEQYRFVPTAQDGDGDPLVFNIQNKPAWANFDSATGELKGVPDDKDVGTSRGIVISVRDPAGAEDALNAFDITVININDTPVIAGQTQDPLTTPEETQLTITLGHLTVNDPDNQYPDDFTLRVLDGDNYGRSSNIITPAADFNGLLSVPVRVNDGQSDSQVFNLRVRVTATNDVPVITGQKPDPLTTPEETPLTITLGHLTVNDPDNQYPDDFTLRVLDGDNYSRNGNIITPAADFNGLLSVPVRVNDGQSDSQVFNLRVRVTATNDAPVITGQKPDPLTTPEETPITITLGHLTVNDPDNKYPEDFTLRVLDGANYTLKSNNTVEPLKDYYGSLLVPVRVNDGIDDSSSFNVQITVQPVNDPPVAAPDNASTTEGTPVTTGNVLANDSDPDGDTLSISGADAVYEQGGTVVNNGDGTFTYTPRAGFTGSDTFSYTVSDGKGETAKGTVTILITSPLKAATLEYPPETPGHCSMIPPGSSVSGRLSAADPDGEDRALRFYLEKQAAKGTVWLSVDGRFTYQPYAGARGVDSFSYQVIDQQGLKGKGQAKIIIGNTRIMPLGDIITAGHGNGATKQSYRAMLRRSLIEEGYAIEFVGSQSEVPDRHEGHSGAEVTTAYVAARIADWLAANPADVILLHVGSQDFVNGGDVAVSDARIADILTVIRTMAPSTIVLLAEIIDREPSDPVIALFNSTIAARAEERQLIVVDQYGALDYQQDLADGFLPNTRGYTKMASTWRRALEKVLEKCP